MKKLQLIIATLIFGMTATAADPKDVTVYINPGHGGHDSDDRNVVIAPYAQGDPNGFWESNSNLDKGLFLCDMLEAKGCKVHMSRVTNTTADDLGLTTIGRLANDTNADMFFSIHSNATGTGSRVNYTLMLFRGFTETPENPEAKVIAKMLGDYLITNQSSVWTTKSPSIYGDFSFGSFGSGPTGGLGVLRVLTIPGMLSEGSFHDYIPETYRLMNMDFKWLEAWHFMKTVNQYMGLSGQNTGHIAGCIYDSRVKRNASYIMHERDVQEPINGATVQLLDLAGTVKQEYTTDNLENGYYMFKNIEPGDYKIKVVKDTHYTIETPITVTADNVAYANIPVNKVRNTAPEVLSYSPIWKEGDAPLLCNTPISFSFNWDMDIASAEAALSITPQINGTFAWSDANYQMTFTPSEPYQANTLYTVSLKKSAQHGGGMTMANDFNIQFRTDERRFLSIIGQSPEDGEKVHYKGASIMVQTDKLINVAYLKNQISLTDSKGAAVVMNRSFSSNKASDAYGWFKYPTASSLVVGEEYTLKLSDEINDKDGLKVESEKVIKFVAVDAAEEKEGAIVLANFDDPTMFSYNSQSSQNCSEGLVTKDTSGKLLGVACGNFKYTFTGTSNGLAEYVLSTPIEQTINVTDKVGIHVNSDMSGNTLYAVMTSGAETVDLKLCDLTFLGWQYIAVDPNALVAGRDYKLTGLKIVQQESKRGVTGAIKLDDILIQKGQSGVEDTKIASLTVYPNPASEYIIANADTLILGMELISASGASVCKVSGNIIYVGNIADGNYLLKIHSQSGYNVEKIVVKK